MSGPWKCRPMARRREDGSAERVWVAYRLADPAGPDEDGNRVYYPRGCQGWFMYEENARRCAASLNAQEKEEPPTVRRTPAGGKAKR